MRESTLRSYTLLGCAGARFYQSLFPLGSREALDVEIERAKLKAVKRIGAAAPAGLRIELDRRNRWRNYADGTAKYIVNGTGGIALVRALLGKVDLVHIFAQAYHDHTLATELAFMLVVLILTCAIVLRSWLDEQLDVLRCVNQHV